MLGKILLIMLDAVNYNMFWSRNGEVGHIPNMRKLSKDGLVFENVYANFPSTLPSITSLFSGYYPFRHNTLSRDFQIPDEVEFFTDAMREKNILTACISGNPMVSSDFGFEKRFDTFLEVCRDYNVTPEDVYFVPAERLVDECIKELKRNRLDKMFLYIHFLQPHNPFEPPEQYQKLFIGDVPSDIKADTETLIPIDRKKILILDVDMRDIIIKKYLSNLYYVDDKLSVLLHYLEDSDFFRDGVLIITSDHGEAFGEHGRYLHNSTVYDEMMRVPFIMFPDITNFFHTITEN